MGTERGRKRDGGTEKDRDGEMEIQRKGQIKGVRERQRYVL